MSAYDNSVAAAKKGRLKRLANDRQIRVTRMQMLLPAIKQYHTFNRQEASVTLACSVTAAARYLHIMEKFGVVAPCKRDSSGRVLSYAPTNNAEAEVLMFAELRAAVDNALAGQWNDVGVPRPEDDDEFDRKYGSQKVIFKAAKQIGIARDALVAALFGDGPAHSDKAVA